jgi:thimet oligopeptidase
MNAPEGTKPTTGRSWVCALGLMMGLSIAGYSAAQTSTADPVYPAGLDTAMLTRLVDRHLAEARAAVERLAAVPGRRTAANTLRPFDDVNNAVENAQGPLAIATQLHPDSAVRAVGNRAEERVVRFSAEFAADPRVARAFAELDTTALSPEERLLVARTRRDYHRAGADRDEPTRARFRALFETLERLSTLFQATLAGDTTKVPASGLLLDSLPRIMKRHSPARYWCGRVFLLGSAGL